MFENKRAVKELIDYVLDEPNTIKAGKSENSVYLGKKDDTKIKDIVVNKSENKIIHANRRRMSTDEIKADGKDAHIPLHTDTMPAGATGANARSSADESIIPKQTQEEFKKLLNEYDVDKFLSDRENILAKNAKYGRNRIADRSIESNGGVGGWEYKLTPAGYEKNYKADFLTTKADVAKIRAGKMDEATFNKLKSDLESSEALGYEYKKASDYADMEDFEREFGSLSNPKDGRTINASPHIASGLLGGTANGTDENGNVSPEEFAKGFIYALFGSKFSASAVKRISPELYNSILGLGKKMPQMAKDNPKLLTKIYGSAKSNSINSFAGEKALNASANKLSKAKAMLEKGEDEVKIWQSTGWYKDKDGAWKFEIDDSPAKIKNQNADKLGDLLEHKELFKAYPELKDINVVKIKDELYNKNLKDWHKESSPLTKNTDGTPKIFYHGTKKSNISEFDQKFDKSKWGGFLYN